MGDPWGEVKQTSQSLPVSQGFQDNFLTQDRLPDSEEYLSRLERKLEKIEGRNSSLKSKDIVNRLQDMRNDMMIHFIESNDQIQCLGDDNIEPSYVERKLFPEKQAITQEELLKLLENDKLAHDEIKKSDEHIEER